MYVQIQQGLVYETSAPHNEALAPGYYKWAMQPVGMTYRKVEMQAEQHEPFEHQRAVLYSITRFMAARPAYARLGLTYKRGFLLHGGPGCGKTTTARMAATEWVLRGGIVLMNGPQDELAGAIKKAHAPVLVLIDDVDGWDERRLTHAMDGLGDVSDVCWLATTNFIGRVSERLRRPGRFDEVIEVKAPPAGDQLEWVRGLDIPEASKAWVIEQAVDCTPSQVRELVIRAGIFGEQRPFSEAPTASAQVPPTPAAGTLGSIITVNISPAVADGKGGAMPFHTWEGNAKSDDADLDEG